MHPTRFVPPTNLSSANGYRLSLVDSFDSTQLLRIADGLGPYITLERLRELKRFCNWYIKFAETPIYEQWDIATFSLVLSTSLPIDCSHTVGMQVRVYFDCVICILELEIGEHHAEGNPLLLARQALEQFADKLFCGSARHGLIRLVPYPPSLLEIARICHAHSWSLYDRRIRISVGQGQVDLGEDGRFVATAPSLGLITATVRTVVNELASGLTAKVDFDVAGHKFIVWKYRRLIVVHAPHCEHESFEARVQAFMGGRPTLRSRYEDNDGSFAEVALAYEHAFQEGRENPLLAYCELTREGPHLPLSRTVVTDLAYACVSKCRSLYTYFLFEDRIARIISSLDRQELISQIRLSDSHINRKIGEVLESASTVSQDMLMVQRFKRDLDACQRLLARMSLRRGGYREVSTEEARGGVLVLEWLSEGPTIVLSGPGALLMNPTAVYDTVIAQVTASEGIEQLHITRLMDAVGTIRRERAENAVRVLGFLLAGSVSAELEPLLSSLVTNVVHHTLTAFVRIGLVLAAWVAISAIMATVFWIYNRLPQYRELLTVRVPRGLGFAIARTHSISVRSLTMVVDRWRAIRMWIRKV